MAVVCLARQSRNMEVVGNGLHFHCDIRGFVPLGFASSNVATLRCLLWKVLVVVCLLSWATIPDYEHWLPPLVTTVYLQVTAPVTSCGNQLRPWLLLAYYRATSLQCRAGRQSAREQTRLQANKHMTVSCRNGH